MMGNRKGNLSFIQRKREKASFVRQQSRLGLTGSNFGWKMYSYSVAVFVFAFLTSFVVYSLVAPVKDSSADTLSSDTVTANNYTLTLSASSAVDMNLSVGESDTMTIKQGLVSVQTNSPSGYKLYINMSKDSAALSLDRTTQTIAGTTGSFGTPTALAAGTWGYAIPSSTAHIATGSGFDPSYSEMTSSTPVNAKFAVPPTKSANAQLIGAWTSATSASGDQFPIYYGVKANIATAPGAYTNRVLFTAIADAAVEESITVSPQYVNPNTAATLTISTTMFSSPTVDINTYLLTAAQYAQVQAGTDVSTLGAETLNCTRTSSSPVALSCNMPAKAEANYYPYVDVPRYNKGYGVKIAVISPTKLWSITYMQEMTPEICGVLTIPNTTATASDTNGSKVGNKAYVPERTLRDSRNNETYRVRKLADGNCWMTENLRLELTAGQKLTSADSDLPSGTTATVGMTTQSYNQPSTNYYNWGVASAADYSRATVDRWLSRSTKVNGVWATETTPTMSGASKTNLTGEDQKTGVYYNWYAATVGTGTWDITTAGTEATSSVCPAGWHLPRYSAVDGTSTLAASGSWMNLIRDTYHLITTQGDQGSTAVNDKLHAFPFSLPYSGFVSSLLGHIGGQGSDGRFWSAGATSQTNARTLSFNKTYVWSEGSNARLDGLSVRCVAK